MKKPRSNQKLKVLTPEIVAEPLDPNRVQNEIEDSEEISESPSDFDDALGEEIPENEIVDLPSKAKADLAGSGIEPSHGDLEVEKSLTRAISPYDPLRRYLEEVQRYPLLEPEEELKLALELREQGGVEAARRLVQANLRLVIKIAFEYRNYYSSLMDLIQEGNYGLMKAVSRFDPSKGAKLSYYASWWIRSYILKYLLDNFRLIKVGTSQSQKKLFYHLMREKGRLEAQGLLAGPAQLAQVLEVPEKDVIEMQQRLSGEGAEVSLDSPINSESGSTRWIDQMADVSIDPENSFVQHELLARLKEQLPAFTHLLSEREKNLLSDRLLAEEPKTLQEIADLYGLTRERARQIEVKLIGKLKSFLGWESISAPKEMKKKVVKTPIRRANDGTLNKKKERK